MGGSGEKVDIVLLYVDRDMGDCLYCICVEQYIFLAADPADFPDGLDGTDFVICKHNGNQACILTDRGFDLFGKNETVFMDVKKGYLETFLFKTLQRVQDGVVFKCR